MDDIKALKEALDEVRRNDGDEKSWPVWDGACTPSRIARVLERLEAAERDAERLDWIEANVCDVARLADKRLRISWWNGVGQVFVGEGHHKDWRSAIDAAMKKEPQQ